MILSILRYASRRSADKGNHELVTALDETVDILVLFFMVCSALFSFCTREISDLAKALERI